MNYAKLYLDRPYSKSELSHDFSTKMVNADFIFIKATYFFINAENKTEHPIVDSIKLSYSKFPIISSISHSIAAISIVGLIAYVTTGFEIIHPYALLWLSAASAGMAIVIGTAAGEFSERQK